MNRLWNISENGGHFTLTNGDFVCTAYNKSNLEQQMWCNGFSEDECADALRQLSASGTSTITLEPQPQFKQIEVLYERLINLSGYAVSSEAIPKWLMGWSGYYDFSAVENRSELSDKVCSLGEEVSEKLRKLDRQMPKESRFDPWQLD